MASAFVDEVSHFNPTQRDAFARANPLLDHGGRFGKCAAGGYRHQMRDRVSIAGDDDGLTQFHLLKQAGQMGLDVVGANCRQEAPLIRNQLTIV
jgi:hypothetical protein